jgi:prepilin-type N-terminal cleavage/methylation domain-containing protein
VCQQFHCCINCACALYIDVYMARDSQSELRRTGFTIVELLIVIVVIGILAAITVVAYNGIQARARNAQQLASAKSYMQALSLYVATNNAYPPTSVNRGCLGLDQSACVTNTSWVRDATLETALKTVVSTLPAANPSVPIIGTPKMGYIPVSDVTLDGVITAFFLYTVVSPETCKVGSPASGTWPNYSSSAPAQGYTDSENNVRVCFIPVPKP